MEVTGSQRSSGFSKDPCSSLAEDSGGRKKRAHVTKINITNEEIIFK